MCQHGGNHIRRPLPNAGLPHHHDDPSDHHQHHHHHEVGSSELTARQKLVIRLEHALHHNSEHAASYEKLAEEAAKLEGEAVALEIRQVARCAATQNEHIEKALSLIQRR
jgi:hypothetical protein